jgi:predicted dehydrogenase
MPEWFENAISRRGFLSKVGVGAAASTVASAIAPLAASASAAGKTQSPQDAPEPPGKKCGYAIVGLGSLAIHQILPAFCKSEKSKVVALVSGHPEKAAKLAARYNVNPKNIYNYENYDTLRDNPAVDIIYIVLPNSMHAEYTIRGFQAGKHVLTEKPMANTPADCREMIDAANKAGKKLMVAYRCRYEPYNQAMIQMARDKALGGVRILLTEAGFNIGDPTQWRLKKSMAGGGSLMDIGIYALNAARYISGEEPTEVNAMLYSTPNDPRFKEVEETVLFQLRFPSGIIASCTSSYGASTRSHFRALCPQGYFELDPAMGYTGARLRVSSNKESSIEERMLQPVDHFAAEMDHMSDCVQQNKTPLTPGEEGLRDLTIMQAIYQAAATGQTVKL